MLETIPISSLADCCLGEKEFIEAALRIVNRAGELVPFAFNSAQRRFEKQKGRFNIILKARKMGFTSRIMAGALWRCAFRDNQRAVLVSHDKDASAEILTEKVIPLLKNSLIPIHYEAADNMLRFPKTGSTYRIGTPRTLALGRGKDITHLELTECAYYPDDSILAGVEEALTDDAEIYIDTTANGENFFKHLWDESKQGRNKYKALFYPWWTDDSYRSKRPVTSITEREKELMDVFKLDLEQIAWRQEKILSMSSPELFPQEYPEYDHEAFLGSGRMVFDWLVLKRHEINIKPPAWTGYLRDKAGVINLEPRADGPFAIWSIPNKRKSYVIGADIAEGIEGGAYSAAVVLDMESGEQAAQWHGRCAPDEFAVILDMISAYYNDAMMCPESWPGPGEVTAVKIREINPRRLLRLPGNDFDGWKTTPRTRLSLIYDLGQALREFRLIIHSQELLSELRSFVYNAKGLMDHSPGTYSDLLIALAIARQAMNSIPDVWKSTDSRSKISGTTSPVWRGPIMGRRNED